MTVPTLQATLDAAAASTPRESPATRVSPCLSPSACRRRRPRRGWSATAATCCRHRDPPRCGDGSSPSCATRWCWSCSPRPGSPSPPPTSPTRPSSCSSSSSTPPSACVQEIKAERAITALSALTAPAARVVRDGTPTRGTRPRTSSSDDLLVLAEGDIVPADARVVRVRRPARRRGGPDRRIRARRQRPPAPAAAAPASNDRLGRHRDRAWPRTRGRDRHRSGQRDGPHRRHAGHRNPA